MRLYKKIHNVIVAFLFAGLASMALPVYAEVEEDGRLWFNQTLQGELTEQVGWYVEMQQRLREEGGDLDQLLLRPALKFTLSANSSVWLGYGYVSTYPNEGDTVHEHRIWQQYLHQFDTWHGLTLSSRTRLEQRHVAGAEDTGHRLRQLLRMQYPLGVMNASVVVWDEYFVHLNDTDWQARRGFDQNRLFVGAAFKCTPQTKLEVGYLNQTINTASPDKSNHVLSTVLAVDF